MQRDPEAVDPDLWDRAVFERQIAPALKYLPNGLAPEDRAAAIDRIEDILANGGLITRDEFDAALALAPGSEDPRKRLHRLHASIADATDGQFRTNLERIVRSHSRVAAELADHIRTANPHAFRLLVHNGRLRAAEHLSDVAVETVRAAARHHAEIHRAHFKQGAPRKVWLNTALGQLAELFASYTQPRLEWFELSHSVWSRFISFARAVMKPFASANECRRSALARAFFRMKKHRETDVPPEIA